MYNGNVICTGIYFQKIEKKDNTGIKKMLGYSITEQFTLCLSESNVFELNTWNTRMRVQYEYIPIFEKHS